MVKAKNKTKCIVAGSMATRLFATISSGGMDDYHYQVTPYLQLLDRDGNSVADFIERRNVLDPKQIIYTYNHLYSTELRDLVERAALDNWEKMNGGWDD